MTPLQVVRQKYRMIRGSLTERSRRLWAAAEAQALGFGGVSLVARATGIARSTIIRGAREPRRRGAVSAQRIRRPGGGRKRATAVDPGLKAALEALVEPVSRGDPESPLRWTCLSTRSLARELSRRGAHRASDWLVRQLLYELDYSLQANRKTKEGTQHPDRDAQFRYINAAVARQLRRGCPAISVDTKKKELVGEFKNGGRTWRPQGAPERVRVHDFLDPTKGKAIPYGVYDLGLNKGWVSVGLDHDTASFAVNTIRRWWREMGHKAYPTAPALFVVADSGGSNGARTRLWKWELQRLANATGLRIHVSHLPPGTSKWNKIEHRLFSFISQNWRGRPLLTHATVVKLIAHTRTATGLTVRCILDRRRYPRDVKVTDEQMATVRLKPHRFHGEWNYSIRPYTQ